MPPASVEGITPLIIQRYRELKSAHPNHEFLRYLRDVTDDGFHFSRNMDFRREFLGKYDPEGTTSAASILSRYSSDLERALSGKQ